MISSQRQKLEELEKTGEYLFHGSENEIDELEPRQAYTVVDAKRVPDDAPGVHATPSLDIAIFMAVINKRTCPEGCNNGFAYNSDYGMHFKASAKTLDQLKANPEGYGYVHVLLKSEFQSRNEMEYISYNHVKPVEIIKVEVQDLPKNIHIVEPTKERPTKLVGSSVLLFNESNQLLIVKSPYKDYWTLPGGGVEENESPKAACIRECKEEVGIEVLNPEFLCVDYQNTIQGGENIQFLFYGGTLNQSQVERIKLQEAEIIAYKFVDLSESSKFLSKLLAKRIPLALDARNNNTKLYLENAELK